MQIATFLGAFAALCSTVSFAPQAWKVIRTRSVKDISTGMYLFTVTAFAAWVGYGVMIGKWPIIVSNGICLLLSAFILAMKVMPTPQKNKVASKIAPKKKTQH